jgi:hypothetical protein
MPFKAWSHSGSTAFIELSVQESTAQGEWLIALRDLEQVVGIDSNQDGKLTAGEIMQRHTTLTTYAQAQLAGFSPDGSQCSTTLEPGIVVKLDDVNYLRWSFAIGCPQQTPVATLRYTALFAQDPMHRLIVKWRRSTRANEQIAVLSPQQQTMRLRQKQGILQQTLALAGEGIVHILQGYDHLLFLLALLAPVVLAKPALSVALRRLLKIITAFTVGHSITLAMTTLAGWSPPSHIVETAIAATVIFAGINILWPLVRDNSWRLALGFGLIHGFGFASALRDLALEPSQLALSLLSFNLGVETGQLLVIALVIPLARIAIHKREVTYEMQLTGTLCTVAAGSIWLLQRLTGFS